MKQSILLIYCNILKSKEIGLASGAFDVILLLLFQVDAGDENNSNYLRYINCSKQVKDQNLVAFQYKGKIYYRTCKTIKAGEELLVFYGKSFAKNLGIDVKKYFEPHCEDIDIENVFCCQYCYVGLSSRDFRDSHERFCKLKPIYDQKLYAGPGYDCKYCKCTCTTEEFLKKHEVRCSKRE